ncbi:MAG: hypothetical protein IKJ00_06225 [Clostridia bacterium]|nr:hypothetical protein [Clostridia bacterium]
MKKIIALLMAILMLLPLVVSCSKKDGEDMGDTISTEEGNGMQMSDKLRGVSFDGEDINIWQTTTATNGAEYFYDMNGSVEDGDFISLKLYERNATVKDYLNVNLNFVDTGSESTNAATDIRPLLQAESGEFEAYQLVQWNGMPLVMEGWFKSLDDNKYLDFEGAWWSREFMDAAKLNGHDYVMAGDVGIDMVSNTGAMFVNKNLLAENYGEDAYENLRTMVLEGKWTIDEAAKLSKDMYRDLNNDSTVDIEDRFGLLCSDAHVVGWYFGAGGTIIQRDSSGKAVLTMGDERSVNVMGRLYNLMHLDGASDYGNNAGTTQLYNSKHSPILVQKFADGEMLFSIGYFYTARNFTNMTDGFAPLPYPKYDVEQQEYYSYIHNIVTLYAIPHTNSAKYDQTGAAFELMASLGNQILRPFYYESVLKLRYIDDEGDTELVDLIYDSRMTDIGVIFDTTAYMIPRYMIMEKRNNLQWYLTKEKNTINKELKAINNVNS